MDLYFLSPTDKLTDLKSCRQCTVNVGDINLQSLWGVIWQSNVSLDLEIASWTSHIICR